MSTPPPGLRIRRATEADAEALHALYHAAYAVHEDPHRAAIGGLKDTLDDVRAYLRDSHILVAEDDQGVLVATVALRRIANIRRLAVAPGHKGEGLGGRLLEAAIDVAREEGFEVAGLDTLDGHPWLPDFYRRHGFVDRGVETLADGTRWRTLRRRL